MDVHIRLTRSGDLSMQIYRQLRGAVLDGRLRLGERLPPTRELARRLEVSRNTVGLAYELLTAEGVLIGRVGSGSFVNAEPMARTQSRRAPTGAVHPRPFWLSVPAASLTDSIECEFDFSICTPDPKLFPWTAWRRLVANELRGASSDYGRYGHPAGHTGLRSAIARHIGVSRAVQASADDVMVTHGAQQAFDLIGRVLITERMCVAVEEPGYHAVRLLFQSLGAHVVGVPVDSEGLDVDAIPDSARMVYVTPSHQYPLGSVMSLQRRAKLLTWAQRRGAVIIEDDYDSEFRFDGRPLDPLQTLDRSGHVIYVGTFSKVLLPTIRVGFLVAPASLQPSLHAAKQLTDWHGELATQAALAHFIDEGLLAQHIRKVMREYESRHKEMAAAMERHFGQSLQPIPSSAGLHLAAEAADGELLDLEQGVNRALRRGVRVRSLSSYYLGAAGSNGLIFGYGGIPAGRIHEGMKRLADSCGRRPKWQPAERAVDS